ncbi:phage tail protein [Pseudomonas sp. SbB1]|uniref:Baseplate J family protein n=1 Tax=Pseudomonas putida (strain GB-1) TaxID=76869 RepID=B0KSZ7_PSEPG|nr:MULTISPECIES: baseplate J/gp47 family protein [Pseudomonas]ABY97115.1 Baseplate J family protein [Pseudomonas putida GB-1]MBP0707712.1 baseplate J/gp47 family protein [Pseudomonas sp. T34]MCK2187153.1 baseplate J/gp47 family protein [Pseudomonas sp. MB04B]MDD2085596.1 baseplate J/gp47 family protein [Pseudomonas putida]MDD2095917.1 baseplate J/gp47 family protein [Pseudomonas putida]
MIDLSLLPPPDVVETLDFETLYQEVLGIFRAHMRDQWTAALESDPVVKLMEVIAYRELVMRARVNAAAKASLLAYATGADLDNRAADYGVQRLTIRAADPDAVPPVATLMESHDALRYRTRLSLEALSVAGSSGAYEYHALSSSAELVHVSVDSPRFSGVAVPAAVKSQLPAGAIVVVCDYDAGLASPLPGDVSLAVLAGSTSTVPEAQLVATVLKALSAEDVRPVTDRPRVQSGIPTDFKVEAVLWVEDGPDPDVVLAAARAGLDAAIADARRLEGQLPVSAIYAALHVTGISRVDLTKPVEGVVCDKRHYPRATTIALTTKVVT